MSIKNWAMGKATGNLGATLMDDMKKSQDESNKFIQSLTNELHALAELLNQCLDAQNEVIKGNVTIYKLMVKIAEKQKVEIPSPLTKMDI